MRKRNCPEGTTRVIGYTRVSTRKQVDTGVSLKAQESQLTEQCAKRGWCLMDIYTDKGKSAKDMSREGIQAALQRLERGEADILFVSEHDRATRSMKDFVDLVDHARTYGWRLVDLTMEIDMSDPYGEAMAYTLVTFNQLARRMTSVKTKAAMAELKAQGVKLGAPKQIDPATVEHMKALRATNLTLGQIAEKLNADGVPTPRGGRWHITSVQRALTA